MSDDQEYVRLHTRFYAGEDDDLIEWLNSLPRGEKTDAVKEALRRGLGLTDEGRVGKGAPAHQTGATEGGLDRQALTEIRRIVETAVESALQQHGASMNAMSPESPSAGGDSGDDEAEEILSMLDTGVTVD